jgi:hypothetical protein
VQFTNLEPWPADIEIVECRTGDRWYDLHNAATVSSIVWTAPDELLLRFRVLHEYEVRRSTVDEVVLRFVGVRQMSLTQPDDWVPEEVDAPLYWIYRTTANGGDGQEREVFFSVAGLDLSFVARGVELIELTGKAPSADAVAD